MQRLGSPSLQTEHSGQLLGLLLPVGSWSGPPSGANSPRSLGLSPASAYHVAQASGGGGHHPPAPHGLPAAVAAHHLSRHGSSRLAIQGSYELPAHAAGEAAAQPLQPSLPSLPSLPPPQLQLQHHTHQHAAYGSAGGLEQHAPAAAVPYLSSQYAAPPPASQGSISRRAHSLLRIDSNSRSRTISPFAAASGAAQQPAAAAAGGRGAAAAAPAGSAGSGMSPFAAVANSIEDATSGLLSCDVQQQAAAGAAAAMPGSSASAASAGGLGAGALAAAAATSSAASTSASRYVSPFAAAAAAARQEGDTEAVFDTSTERNARGEHISSSHAGSKPAPLSGAGTGKPPPAAPAAAALCEQPAGGNSRAAVSPFAAALLQQQQQHAPQDRL
jgi:hypothetical protein